MKRRLALAGGLFCALLAFSAHAGSVLVRGDRVQVTVTYKEADLRRLDGAKALALRIRVAAASACSGDDPGARIGDRFTSCRETAIARAIKDINSPLLADALGRVPPGR